MIGQTIESRPPSSQRPVLALVLAGGLFLLAALTPSVHWAIAGVLPVVVAAAWWGFEKRAFRAEFTETSLDLREPPVSIPYAEIEGLQAKRPANPYQAGPASYAIRVIHAGGAVQLPPRLTCSSDEVYSFLYHRLSSHGSWEVDPALHGFLREKEQRYGPERVWTYARRAFPGGALLSRAVVLFWLGCLVGGLLWLVAGVVVQEINWVAAGIGLVIVSAVFAVALWGLARTRPRQPPGRGKSISSLVICPDGLALAQGTMVGQLRWDEIRTMTLTGGQLVLHLDGAEITLVDIYDRPLPLIRQLLAHYSDPAAGRQAPWTFDATKLRDANRDGEAGRFTGTRQQLRE